MNELQITEYKNIRVLTTQQIAEAYSYWNNTEFQSQKLRHFRYSPGPYTHPDYQSEQLILPEMPEDFCWNNWIHSYKFLPHMF